MDISVTVPRLPGPGATVLGGAAAFAPGGKGANQAVAAARLGGSVRMIGVVGDDDFGARLRASLDEERVDSSGVRSAAGVPTGLAMITVDEAGENIITVAPGANREVGAEEIATVNATAADVLVISAEIPVAAIRAVLVAEGAERADQAGGTERTEAADRAGQKEAVDRAEGARRAEEAAGARGAQRADGTDGARGRGRRPVRVLNLAPAPPEAAELVASGVDWLVVNESEAAAVLGSPVTGLAGAASAAAKLARAGARHAVVTAGAAGAAYCGPGAGTETGTAAGAANSRPRAHTGTETGSATGAANSRSAAETETETEETEVVTVPGFPVRAVDTVGAGDTFVGALAVALAAGIPAVDAVRAAAAAGAAAATRQGTQSGMPRPPDILATTGFPWPIPGT